MTAPKRRWFQWSLRTMFVVVTGAGIACGLGWINHRVNDRDRVLKLLNQRGALTGSIASEAPSLKLPFLWTTFGARPIGVIVLPDGAFTDGELAEIAVLFPESSIQQRTHRLDMPGMGRGR